MGSRAAFSLECWRAHLAAKMKEMTMSQRNLVLGSVASLALVGVMLAAVPG
jgi:hypothetical protein